MLKLAHGCAGAGGDTLRTLPSVEAVLTLFSRLQNQDPAALQAFEYMGGAGMALVLKHIPGATLPLASAPHYALFELATSRADRPACAPGWSAVLEAGA